MIETFVLDLFDLLFADAEALGDYLARSSHADVLILSFDQCLEDFAPQGF